MSPLQHACQMEFASIAELLLCRGAAINFQLNVGEVLSHFQNSIWHLALIGWDDSFAFDMRTR